MINILRIFIIKSIWKNYEQLILSFINIIISLFLSWLSFYYYHDFFIKVFDDTNKYHNFKVTIILVCWSIKKLTNHGTTL